MVNKETFCPDFNGTNVARSSITTLDVYGAWYDWMQEIVCAM